MTKQQRNRYSDEFKAEALKLAENTSVASAARKLELHESQIYGWRSAAKKGLAFQAENPNWPPKMLGLSANSRSRKRSWLY